MNPDPAKKLVGDDPRSFKVVVSPFPEELAWGKGRMMGESAVFCLERCGHVSGAATMQVSADIPATANLFWKRLSSVEASVYMDLQESTEHGACAVALLVIRETHGDYKLERALKGTGVDWWLTYDDPELPFSGDSVRLEVSGIISEGQSVGSRVKLKKRQVMKGGSTGPAFIAIVDFYRLQVTLSRAQ